MDSHRVPAVAPTVSRLRSLPRDPRQQLAVAAVGPLSSVAVGFGCAALAVAARVAFWPARLDGGPLLARAAWANLVLAGFNLVPALPLDGGRVLRAFLAERMGGDAATIIAGRIGRLLAAVMMLAGLQPAGRSRWPGGRLRHPARCRRRGRRPRGPVVPPPCPSPTAVTVSRPGGKGGGWPGGR